MKKSGEGIAFVIAGRHFFPWGIETGMMSDEFPESLANLNVFLFFNLYYRHAFHMYSQDLAVF